MELAWKVEAGSKVKLRDYDPNYIDKHTDPTSAKAELEILCAELGELQELLAAAQYHSLLVVLQGMDTSGKDGTIRHVFSQVNPQGCEVRSFKAPTNREQAHDFLWRIHRGTPGRGIITIFNRSHYEDVLVVRVHNLVPEKVWSRRYVAINNFERLLAQNGMIILKFYLHISNEEQEKRLLARQKDKTKHGNSPPPIGPSGNTGVLIKKPMKTRSPGAVRMKLPGISCLRTRNGLAICSWHEPSLTPCVNIRINCWTN